MKQLNYEEIDKMLLNINVEINFLNYLIPINFWEENEEINDAIYIDNIILPNLSI